MRLSHSIFFFARVPYSLTTVWVNSCLYCANRCTFVLSARRLTSSKTRRNKDCKVSFYKELTGRTKVLERLAENGHPRASISAKRKRVEVSPFVQGRSAYSANT